MQKPKEAGGPETRRSELCSPHSARSGAWFPPPTGLAEPPPPAQQRSHSPQPARWHLRQHVAKGNGGISGLLGMEGCCEHRATPGQGEANSRAFSDQGIEPCPALTVTQLWSQRTSWVLIPQAVPAGAQGPSLWASLFLWGFPRQHGRPGHRPGMRHLTDHAGRQPGRCPCHGWGGRWGHPGLQLVAAVGKPAALPQPASAEPLPAARPPCLACPLHTPALPGVKTNLQAQPWPHA